VLHLIGHGQLLNDHILAYLAPFVFLSIAGLFGYLLRFSGITVPANAAKAAWLKGAVFVIFCGVLIFGIEVYEGTTDFVRIVFGSVDFPNWERPGMSISALILLIAFSLGAIILSMALRLCRLAPAYGLTLCFSGFLALVNVQTTSIAIASYDASNNCGYMKDQYESIVETYLALKKFDPDIDLRLWYRNNEAINHPGAECQGVNIDLTTLYGGVLGMRGFTAILSAEYFLLESYLSTYSLARLANEVPSKLPPLFRAAIIARNPRDHEVGIKTLESHGFKIRVLDKVSIDHEVISFDITVMDVKKDARRKANSRI